MNRTYRVIEIFGLVSRNQEFYDLLQPLSVQLRDCGNLIYGLQEFAATRLAKSLHTRQKVVASSKTPDIVLFAQANPLSQKEFHILFTPLTKRAGNMMIPCYCLSISGDQINVVIKKISSYLSDHVLHAVLAICSTR